MSLHLLAGPALALGVTLAIVAPARADETRAQPRIDLSHAIARHALEQAALVRHALERPGATRALAPNPVPTEASTTATASSLFSIDFAQMRKVVLDLADEAVNGLKSAAIHLPFEMRVTPESAVSWVKGLFSSEDVESVHVDEGAIANTLHTVSFSETAPCAPAEPLFIPAGDIDQPVRAVTVLRMDQDHGFDGLRALQGLGEERDAREAGRFSFEFRAPALLSAPAEAEVRGGWLCRVLSAG